MCVCVCVCVYGVVCVLSFVSIVRPNRLTIEKTSACCGEKHTNAFLSVGPFGASALKVTQLKDRFFVVTCVCVCVCVARGAQGIACSVAVRVTVGMCLHV